MLSLLSKVNSMTSSELNECQFCNKLTNLYHHILFFMNKTHVDVLYKETYRYYILFQRRNSYDYITILSRKSEQIRKVRQKQMMFAWLLYDFHWVTFLL